MKKSALILGILIVSVVGGIYSIYRIGTTGFTNPPCAEKEISLNIPDNLKNATIIFDKPMLYVMKNNIEEYRKTSYWECSLSGMKSKGNLHSIDSNFKFDWSAEGNTTQPVPKEEKFKMIGHVYISCRPLSCLGGGGLIGDIYLLENEKGEIWKIGALTFKNLDVDTVTKPWKAGYYDEKGLRLGDVMVQKVQCYTSFSGAISDCK